MRDKLRRFLGTYGDANGKPPDEKRGFSAVELLLIFLLFFVIAFALQQQGFHSEMVYDSGGLITQNEAKFAAHDTSAVMGIVPARPLFMISFYFNYLFTGLDPYYFRLFNTAILAATGAALTLLILTIFQLPGSALPGTPGEKRAISIALGSLFVAHPLQSYVVSYVWQREAIMACLFYFAGLAAYLGARAGYFRNERRGLVLTSLLFLAGILCKENVVTFPAALLLAELIFFRQTLKQTVSRAFTIALIVLPPALIHLFISQVLHGQDSAHAGGLIQRLINHFTYAGLGFSEVLMTASRVVFSYLSMIVFPSLDGVEFIRAEIISRSLINPPSTLPAVAGIIGLVAIGIACMRRLPAIAFGILFYLGSLVPESILIPQYLFFGYRAILPMAGVLLVMGSITLTLFAWGRTKLSAGLIYQSSAVILVCCFAYFGAVTFHQARTWSPDRFWKYPTDKLVAFTEDIEVVPYLDIAVNYMVLLYSKEKHDELIDLFMKIAGKSDGDGSSQTRSEALKVGAEDVEDAVEDFYAKFKSKPLRTASALQCLAHAFVSTGRYSDAIKPYRRAADANPREVAVYLNLGALLENSGKLDEALEEYGMAVAADPQSAAAHNSLGAAMQKTGNLSAAVEMYEKAVQLDPKFIAGHYNLANALALSGRMDDAVKRYKKTIELNPNLAEARHNLGRAMAVFGEFEEAIANYEKAIAVYESTGGPNSVLSVVHNDLALALEYSGKTSQAIKHFRKAVQLNPAFVTAHYRLGQALRKLGRPVKAVGHLRKAVEFQPNSAEAQHSLGAALASMGRLDKAAEHYRKALSIDPSLTAARLNLGVILNYEGNSQEAVRMLRMAVALDPKSVPARSVLARSLEATGHFVEASEQYRAAMSLQPNSPRIVYELGTCLLKSGRIKESIRFFRKTVELKPDFTDAHAKLAVALLKAGEIPEAIVTLGKALSLSDENADLFNALGMAFAEMGKRREAERQFKRALSLDRHHREAKMNLEKLGIRSD